MLKLTTLAAVLAVALAVVTVPLQAEETLWGGVRTTEADWDEDWFPNPLVDLPRSGRGGIHILYPEHGGKVAVDIRHSPSLYSLLEPSWRFDPAARERLLAAGHVLEQLTAVAYLEWSRHLDYDPGSVTVQVGSIGEYRCGDGSAAACHSPDFDMVILDGDWIADNYRKLAGGHPSLGDGAVLELLAVIMHEAGHQFGYENPHGMRH